tara:strand:+ start:534 stop:1025 length:492 start_codon:yes stop_codon:yes gene_type:complete
MKNKRSQKKAQAAMEFLMTYGWALLVVLIAIGALAFFGVLNPSRFLPNSCTLAPGFACTDFKADASGNVVIVLQNGLGEQLNAVTLELTSVTGATCSTQTFNGGTAFTFNDGGSTSMSLGCSAATMSPGTKLKGDLTIRYTIGTGSNALTHSKVGQLVTGIEA